MEMEEQKECDLEMIFEDEIVTMEVDDQTLASPEPMQTEELLEEVKKKRTDRRKTFLKDLEVCDLLDLRDPQCVSEYATDIWEWMKAEEARFIISKTFLDTT